LNAGLPGAQQARKQRKILQKYRFNTKLVAMGALFKIY